MTAAAQPVHNRLLVLEEHSSRTSMRRREATTTVMEKFTQLKAQDLSGAQYEQEAGGKLVIAAATRERLLDELMNFSGIGDRDFAADFILTYEYFMEPHELLDELQSYYFCDVPSHIVDPRMKKIVAHGYLMTRKRVVHIIRTWINTDVADFFYTEGLESEMLEFLDLAILAETDAQLVRELQSISRLLVSLEPTHEKNVAALDTLKGLANSKNAQACVDAFDFLKTPVDKLAQQLTLIDHAYFTSVKPTECLWLGKDKEDSFRLTAPHMAAWLDRFSRLQDWVASQVVKERKDKLRIKTVEHMIRLAEACFDMRNFNSCFSIVVGLNCNSTERLKKTWAKVDPELRANHQWFLDMFVMKPNFVAYKTEIEPGATPVVPLVAAYKKWLVVIDMLNKNETDDQLINFTKLRSIGTVVARFIGLQQGVYYFERDEALATYFMNMERSTLSKDALMEASIKIEEWRGAPLKDMKTAPSAKPTSPAKPAGKT